jgi:hypothetical protein
VLRTYHSDSGFDCEALIRVLRRINQIVTYAEALGCSEAVLVYPSDSHPGVSTAVGGITVRTIDFPLDGDLDAAGQDVLAKLVEWLHA